MKKTQNLLIVLFLAGVSACTQHLDVQPQGVISESQLQTPEEVEKLIISAYAFLAQDHYTVPNVLWPWGNLRAGDAYKGGDGPADIAFFNALEVFSTIVPDMRAFAPSVLGDLNNKKWERQYIGISRVNTALRNLNAIDDADFDLKNQRKAELLFLRGHFYFDLKIIYKNIPWIDENASTTDIQLISNTDLSSQELWDKIAADFKFAVENLPQSQADIGRPNKYTALAYLAKVKLYQAYIQNEQHDVVEIDRNKLEEVVSLVEAFKRGPYHLENDFANPFLWEYENGPEAVWQIQRSKDDGTITGNLDFASMLNNPMGPEFGCCGFHRPSQNLVNSFKTDAYGHPQFEYYNIIDLLPTDYVDPRLDHTVARVGKPWKYEPDLIYDETWARQPGIYGTFSSLKENVSPNCPSFERIPPFMASSKNNILIRYSDVLLWKAEALIELGRHGEALPIINKIRERAARSTALLIDKNNQPLSKYKVEPYSSAGWTQDFARTALRWERRLELAMEGHRFFDLVRWGIAKETLDEYFAVEKVKRDHLQIANFQKNKNEYMPIPQAQINLSRGLYKQNYGY